MWSNARGVNNLPAFLPGAPAPVRTALRRVYDEFTHHMLLFPNNTGMTFVVAATAWKHRLGCTAFNARVPEALRRFRYAYRGYIVLQKVDAGVLEPHLPAAGFYNLMLAARKPG